MKLFSLAGFFLVSSVAAAQPFISSVDTSQLGAGKLTIAGNSFGPGPSVDLFDNFETLGPTAGNTIPLSSPTIGTWTSTQPPVYSAQSESHSGSYSAKMKNNPQLRLVFKSGVQEAFLSYWVRVPNGTNFPGATSPGVFPSVSSWKFAWLIDQDYQGNSSDLCVPSHVGSGVFHLSGNDFNLETKLGNSWWSWNSWVRIAVWLRANPVDPTAPGDVLFQTVSEENGVAENWMSRRVFDADGPALKQYQYVNLPGWVRSGAPLYDDIYIASGANAIARVELADAANYSQAHQVAVQPSTSWSTGKITVDVNQGGLSSLNNVYLFVWDKDGNRNPTGYPLSAGLAPPMAPSSIH